MNIHTNKGEEDNVSGRYESGATADAASAFETGGHLHETFNDLGETIEKIAADALCKHLGSASMQRRVGRQ